MDKRKSIINVSVSIISYILLLIAALIIRRLLIRYIGNDINGLNSLYNSIIGFLAVAELGAGSAISYSMYKPIVEGDRRKVAALYGLYQRLYRIIGVVILGMGMVVMPFLPYLINDYDTLNTNIYLSFFLLLVSVVLSYLYGAKTSLIEAYKDNYITTGILAIAQLIRYGLQAVAIILFQSFPLFLVCQIVETVLVWILTEIVVRKRHGEITTCRSEEVDSVTRSEITKNIKAMFMHKTGMVLVKTIDSVIISAFIGVMVLGKYSNYVLIAQVLAGTIALVFSPLTSIVGHLCAGGDKERIKRNFDRFYFLNYAFGVVFFLGYYAVIDSLVVMLFGAGLEVSKPIVFIITLNQFTAYMRHTALLFRNASGAFYFDRWKPIAEGITNLALSLLFVQIFPEDLKVVGVIVATIITTMFICHVVDPFVVYKHVLGKTTKEYYLRNYSYIGLFTIALIVLSFLVSQGNGVVSNGLLSVAVSVAVLGLVMTVDRSFRNEVMGMGRMIRTRVLYRVHRS